MFETTVYEMSDAEFKVRTLFYVNGTSLFILVIVVVLLIYVFKELFSSIVLHMFFFS
jgi:hypothetical protein